MLIVNADDYGKNHETTKRILECYRAGSITSATAMVFMEGSESAAQMARSLDIPIGLHLNLTDAFTGTVSPLAASFQQRVSSFLRRSKYHCILYNPSLRTAVDCLFKLQYEEFVRLYRKEPTHIDGHHHAHLCTNMLLGKVIPESCKVRRTFSFARGEKSMFNLLYRRILDLYLGRRYRCTDKFFSITPISNRSRIRWIVGLAASHSVELMVHPERGPEYEYLTGFEYLEMISSVKTGSYAVL